MSFTIFQYLCRNRIIIEFKQFSNKCDSTKYYLTDLVNESELFIYVQRNFFQDYYDEKYGSYGLLEKKLGGHVSRRASSTCRSARTGRRDESDVSFLF